MGTYTFQRASDKLRSHSKCEPCIEASGKLTSSLKGAYYVSGDRLSAEAYQKSLAPGLPFPTINEIAG